MYNKGYIMTEKLQKLDQDEIHILTGLVKGYSKADIIAKYKVPHAKYSKVRRLYSEANTDDIDNIIDRLTKKSSLAKAADILDVSVIDDVQGLARLDRNMQNTADLINTKLTTLAAEADSSIEVLTVVQAFALLRKSMFDKGVVINSQTNINHSKIIGNRA